MLWTLDCRAGVEWRGARCTVSRRTVSVRIQSVTFETWVHDARPCQFYKRGLPKCSSISRWRSLCRLNRLQISTAAGHSISSSTHTMKTMSSAPSASASRTKRSPSGVWYGMLGGGSNGGGGGGAEGGSGGVGGVEGGRCGSGGVAGGGVLKGLMPALMLRERGVWRRGGG